MVWQKLRKFAGHFVARPVALLLGLGLTAIAPNLAQGATLEHRALSRSENFFASLNTRLIAQQQSAVFVYGTSPVAQQLGQDYMVLQVNDNNRVQGVFYQVNSEYACFSGAINNGKLDLAVLDPYEQWPTITNWIMWLRGLSPLVAIARRCRWSQRASNRSMFLVS